MTPILPPTLADGAAVRVSFDAGAVDMQDVDAGVALLRRHGWRCLYDAGAHGPYGYLAAPDATRILDIQHGLHAPHVGALWSARGGFGCTRILDQLPQTLRANPKWLIGYSDITALHLWANAQGVASIHGPMVSGLAKHGQDLPGILNALRAIVWDHHIPPFSGLQTVHLGRSTGRLLGGNLSLIQTLLGTPYLPSLDGVILFVEEIGESAYRVDRLLSALLLGGRAKGIRGIVFGEFTNCRGLEDARLAPRLEEWTRAFGCPVVMGFPAGHGTTNQPFVLGVDYTLDALAGTLTPCAAPTHKDTMPAEEREPPAPTLHPVVEAPASKTIEPQRLIVPSPRGFERGAGYFPATRVAAGGILQALQQALENGVATGIQLVASKAGQRTHSFAVGCTGVLHDVDIAPITPFTLFDLASLTKPLSTVIHTFQQIERGSLSLDSRVPLPDAPTVEMLLSHRSGRLAWADRYTDARTMLSLQALENLTDSPATLEQVWLHDLWNEPIAYPDRRCEYSDFGYILLGIALTKIWKTLPRAENAPPVFDDSLLSYFQREIADVLGLRRTGFRMLDPVPEHSKRPRLSPRDFAATEWCPHRQRTLQGVVHDEHCQLMGSVSGHAGLFGTAIEVDTIAQSLLGYGPPLLTQASIDAMWSKPAAIAPLHGATAVDPALGAYTRGWDTPSTTPSNAGSLMTPGATVGHLGYAGTSLWIDREREIAITLLTNRVHPTRESQAIRAFRPLIHDLVMRELL